MDIVCVRYKELSQMLYEELKDLRDQNVLPRHERAYAGILLRYAELDVFSSVGASPQNTVNDCEPSEPDIEMTRKLWAAGKLICIGLVDHIIFSEGSFYSFKAHAML